MTFQVSERTIDNYFKKLAALNSLSVLHAIYAFQVVLKEFELSTPGERQILNEMLERVYKQEDSIRALPEGNKFGLEHLATSQKLIEAFFAMQHDTSASLGNATSDGYDQIISSQRISLSNYILKYSSVSRNREDIIGLIAEYLVTVDSQYNNPILYPEKIYLRDEIADRSAAFAVAAFVMNQYSQMGDS